MLQMSAMKACFQIAECSKSSAKIMENNGKTMENTQKVPMTRTSFKKKTSSSSYPFHTYED